MSDSDLSLVRARRAEIAKIRAELDTEDADLDVTERTLARLAAARRPDGQTPGKKVTFLRRSTGSQPSHKDMIVGVLRSEPSVWINSVSDLQSRVKEVHGVDIPKTSLFPYISSLKTDGIVVRGPGGEIALKSRISNRTEAAE